MSELLFPAAALAVMFCIIMPLATIVSRQVLASRRSRAATWADFGSSSTWAWIVAPTILPLAWLASAAAHSVEEMGARGACVLDHQLGAECLDAWLLLGAVLLITGGVFVWRIRLEGSISTGVVVADGSPLRRRVTELALSVPALRSCRIAVSRGAPAPVFACGWFRPRIVLDACFVEANDDDVLVAALLHEAEHAQAHDPLRVLLARVCLTLNPVGRLLEADLQRWRNAREAACDHVAVQEGGNNLALAEGIVRAARFRCDEGRCGVTALGGPDASALRLRLALLMQQPKALRAARGRSRGIAIILIAAAMVPHTGESSLLEHFHAAIEQLVLGSGLF